MPLARLCWFKNGAHTDIKLTLQRRTLKVWLVSDPSKVDTKKIAAEAEASLEKLRSQGFIG